MLNMQVRIDTGSAKALFGDELPKAMPYLKAAMLSRLASGGRDAVQKQMPVDFDRPTAYTVRGVWLKAATKARVEAEVFIPESQDAGGRAAREYLQPGVAGSPKRRQKRTEYLLSRMGFLPSGWVTVPGSSAVKLGMIDGFGNLKGRIYAQVINVLQIKRADTKGARGISDRSVKRAKKMGVQTEWFAVTPGKNTLGRKGSWLPPGVYRRAGRSGEELQQILKFVHAAAYRPRLDFDGTVRGYVEKNTQAAWTAATSSVFQKFNSKV